LSVDGSPRRAGAGRPPKGSGTGVGTAAVFGLATALPVVIVRGLAAAFGFVAVLGFAAALGVAALGFAAALVRAFAFKRTEGLDARFFGAGLDALRLATRLELARLAGLLDFDTFGRRRGMARFFGALDRLACDRDAFLPDTRRVAARAGRRRAAGRRAVFLLAMDPSLCCWLTPSL